MQDKFEGQDANLPAGVRDTWEEPGSSEGKHSYETCFSERGGG